MNVKEITQRCVQGAGRIAGGMLIIYGLGALQVAVLDKIKIKLSEYICDGRTLMITSYNVFALYNEN